MPCSRVPEPRRALSTVSNRLGENRGLKERTKELKRAGRERTDPGTQSLFATKNLGFATTAGIPGHKSLQREAAYICLQHQRYEALRDGRERERARGSQRRRERERERQAGGVRDPGLPVDSPLSKWVWGDLLVAWGDVVSHDDGLTGAAVLASARLKPQLSLHLRHPPARLHMETVVSTQRPEEPAVSPHSTHSAGALACGSWTGRSEQTGWQERLCRSPLSEGLKEGMLDLLD
ncbi:hypothetical protein DPEC_G00315020 [Dallia pectoralis]|uniref:Uncharacterized protein n=1 Tax=Dallia pectoralis TaxID=75939 RepID=A0ACC2FC63_DALPE|nr:hypothetical protein DPEC_G00315020 [Dallia pectoralis]